ncbi:pickpocket protein 19-like [Haematobia irritans]|uniref:pickpocket protein 19-like n=1 Tax=Haematobia irritans TaxID=7368 RepID=UPI003F4F6B0F
MKKSFSPFSDTANAACIMFYPNELVRYKNTNFEHPKGLQTFNVTLVSTQRKANKTKSTRKLPTFCKECFDGIQYIWEPGIPRPIRIFWLLILIIGFAGCITMYTMLTKRHRDQVLVTIVDTPRLPVYSIPFPAVALCPFNHINWIRHKAAEEKFLPLNATDEMRKIFHDLLVATENMGFSLLNNLGDFTKLPSIPSAIQNIVLKDLFEFMAFRCNEIFTSCTFDETDYDCCKIFVREHTEKGLSDNFYPWRVRGAGETSSLSFRLRYNSTYNRPETYNSFRFSVMIKESHEWGEPLFHIFYPNTHNDVSVTPIMTETSSNARALSPAKRNCLYSDEQLEDYEPINGLPYNKLNCQAQCQHKYVMRRCNCSLSIYFPHIRKYGMRECRASDLGCLYRHRDVFNYLKGEKQDMFINDTRRGMECDCMDNCLSVIFLVTVNTQPIHSTVVNKSVPEIHVHVYFTQDKFMKYGARMEFTTLDLLASFGGVLGLCLGASVLSFFEIIYAIMRYGLQWLIIKWRKRRHQRRVRTLQTSKE